MKLKGKKAIVTGGASGMGKATAELFAKEGAVVAILDINEEEGKKTIKGIKQNGGEGIFLKTDLSKSKEVSKSIVNVPISTAKAVQHITKEYLHEKNNNDPKDKRFKSDN